MSNKALNFVWENSQTKGTNRVLMLCIADMANDNGECYPGKANLAKKINVTTLRQVRRVVRDCEVLGELRVIERTDDAGDPTSNLYLLVGMASEKMLAKARAVPEVQRKDRPKLRRGGGLQTPTKESGGGGGLQTPRGGGLQTPQTISTEPQDKNTPAESAGGPSANGAKSGSRAATTGKSAEELEREAKEANDRFIAIQQARLNEPADRIELLDAILEVFNAGGGEAGEAGMYMKMLRGVRKYKARKKGQVDEFDNQAHLFRERPVSAEELRRWAADYRAANPSANMVRVPLKVASSIDAWRAKQVNAPTEASYKDVELADGPTLPSTPVISAEQKAKNARELAALKRANHGR
jgi:hypothetical protein